MRFVQICFQFVDFNGPGVKEFDEFETALANGARRPAAKEMWFLHRVMPIKGFAFQVACPLEERQQTFAINYLLAVEFDPGNVHERGIQIVRDNRLVADHAGLDLSGPTYDAGRP